MKQNLDAGSASLSVRFSDGSSGPSWTVSSSLSNENRPSKRAATCKTVLVLDLTIDCGAVDRPSNEKT